MLGGWAFVACRRTKLVTPGLVLTFVLASVILSPIQGPLGVANSALVLFSVIAVGLSLDLPQIAKGRREVASTTRVVQRSRNQRAVSATPCSIVYGNAPQTARVGSRSKRYWVNTLFKRNELNGNR